MLCVKQKKKPTRGYFNCTFSSLESPAAQVFFLFFYLCRSHKKSHRAPCRSRVAPLLRSLWYWVHLGSVRSLHTPPAPIGFSPWLLGSFSGHAWRGRCIDLVVQMPSDAHQHNTDTHITSKCTHMARSHTTWILYIPTFYRFLCNFVFNETSAPCMLRWT